MMSVPRVRIGRRLHRGCLTASHLAKVGKDAQIKKGKVAASNIYFDNMGFMQQLGLLPPSPHAVAKTAVPGAQKMSAR
jgi:hypothetical protein